MCLLNDKETKVFDASSTMKDFFKDQYNTDIWQTVFINELKISGIDNNPIMVEQVKTDLGMNVPDIAVTDAMGDTQLGVTFPYHNKLVSYPLRFTSIPSLMDRAMIYGVSVSNGVKSVCPTDKASVFNYCLSNKDGKTLILIRDDKVSGLFSGDENDYSILPTCKLMEVLEKSLILDFPDVEWVSGQTSHEYTTCTYVLNDPNIGRDFEDIMYQHGCTINGNVKSYICFFTSDVASAAASIYPYIQVNSILFPVGKPLYCTHKNKHSVTDFAKLVGQSMSMFKNAADNMEKLASIKIKNPGGCLRNIACTLGLSKKASLIQGEKLDSGCYTCTAFDIYWNLNEIVTTLVYNANQSGKPYSLRGETVLQESVARALFFNFNEYDCPFTWKN